MFSGSMVALITPMQQDGRVDYQALSDLVQFHLDNQTDGLVILGTTGESPTINAEEHAQIVSAVIKQVAGKIPVISGVGTNCTAKTISNAQADAQLGVDGLLIAAPYYNKPTQEGLYQHYKNIAQHVDKPIILYNHLGRTAVDILPETVARLAGIDNIIGIKETLSVERVHQLRQLLATEFEIYCGDDSNNLAMLENGAQGIISVTANLAPKFLHDMCKFQQAGKRTEAEQIHQQLAVLHQQLCIETNPIPVKWALAEMGLINPGIRLPLTWLSESSQIVVKQALADAKIGE